LYIVNTHDRIIVLELEDRFHLLRLTIHARALASLGVGLAEGGYCRLATLATCATRAGKKERGTVSIP
jgi:hypothetical protein